MGKSKIAESIKSGPLKPMVPGAGKSGSTFGMLADGSFKVKFGLKYTKLINEPDNLMSMMAPVTQGAVPMLKHFDDHPESLLNRIYGMFKLRIGEKMTYVLLMEDAFFNMDAKIDKAMTEATASQTPIVYTRYDLKGASRDQTERKYDAYCLVNGDFQAMEEARVRLQDEQCLKVRSAMEAGANFLA